HRVGAERQSFCHRGDHGNRPAEAEDVLGGLPRGLAVEHRHHALGLVADNRIGRLARHRPEIAIGDDQVPALCRRAGLRGGHDPPFSPFPCPCPICLGGSFVPAPGRAILALSSRSCWSALPWYSSCSNSRDSLSPVNSSCNSAAARALRSLASIF